jgi:hypothetical protein
VEAFDEAGKVEVDATIERVEKEKVMSVKVSTVSHKKAVQLHKFLKYSSAKRAWGKDEKLLRYNLLLVPTSKNYTVLLALGRRAKANFEE